jgi:hypothetical protein
LKAPVKKSLDMIPFKEIIRNIYNTSAYSGIKISDYAAMLGYRDKHSLFRFLKNHNYNVSVKQEKVDCRSGKEYYIHPEDMIRLLSNHYASDSEWKDAYIDHLRIKFNNRIFRFSETKTKTYRSNLKNFIEAKGALYDYSLNTLNFAYAIHLCPYECYKLANERCKPSYRATHFDSENNIPLVCFDSLEHRHRVLFLKFMDIVLEKMTLTEAQKLILQAYRLSVSEILDYQQSIDESEQNRKKTRKNDEESRLKDVYRQASRLFHPDVNKTLEAEDIMKQVNAFYEKKNYHSIRNLINKSIHSI